MTVNELASAIRNHVADGLKGVTNISFSKQQIIDEAFLLRAKFILEREMVAKFDINQYTQHLPKIFVDCKDVSRACVIKAYRSEGYMRIPAPATLQSKNPITYFGTLDLRTRFKVYYSKADALTHQYRYKTSCRPYILVDLATKDSTGYVDAYFMLRGNNYKMIEWLTLDAVFSDPRVVFEFTGDDDTDFPAPPELQKAIIDTLSNEYINYYRKLNHMAEPNLQTSINS
jgi:hypothetical protein